MLMADTVKPIVDTKIVAAERQQFLGLILGRLGLLGDLKPLTDWMYDVPCSGRLGLAVVIRVCAWLRRVLVELRRRKD